mmetsp:Transcript_20362/g.44933  ORF Transcript_20362/g.44933 Transcript_20362/m.44933 type:complete len:231 (-) Transcript_20362:25-717(-)
MAARRAASRRVRAPFAALAALWLVAAVISLVQLNFVGPGISPPRRLARGFRSMRLVQQRAGPEIEPAPGSRKSFDLVVGKYYHATVLKFYRNATSLALGVEKPGYLHVSKMKPKEEFVVNASDILNLKDVIPVRILKIKQKEVEVVMPEAEAEQPEFQKRPLWEYKDGEEVDGTVAALRQRAVFVDVGAMVDAYFPEENWGAMKGKMEVGQKLKFRIEKVTGCRMTLTEA